MDQLFALLVIAFIFLSFYSSLQESVTIDEFRHLSTGVYYWQGGSYYFDNETPPLWKMAMALPAYLAGAKPVQFRQLPEIAVGWGWEPWFVATDFMRDNAAGYTGYLQSARLVNILVAALCMTLLYLYCRRRFGAAAALLGTGFMALSPTFLAHSHYATTDIIATLTIMAAVFFLWDYLLEPRLRFLALASTAFSLSMLCKYTALILLPLFAILPCLAVLSRARNAATVRPFHLILSLLKPFLVIIITILLVLNLFYVFKDTGATLREMPLKSRFLSAMQQSLAADFPMPVPAPLIIGFDRQKSDSDFSEFPAFLNGKWSDNGFRSYYVAAFSMKESVPFLLLLAGAFVIGFQRKKMSNMELVLVCYVPVTLFIVLSFLNRLNVGVRYLLPAYPFFCLLIAGLYCSLREWRGVRLALPFLFVLHCLSVLRIAPQYTAYFNELAGGPGNGYRHLIDSNIDWGQDLLRLRQFMTKESIDKVQLAYFGHGLPEFYGINYEPLALPAKPGYVAVSVTLLQGHPYFLTYLDPPQLAEAGQFRDLRRMEPVGRAGYSILIYKID
jgi:4-amino-4-deoxy-L-arabinose transferase-like glycosyltransferase